MEEEWLRKCGGNIMAIVITNGKYFVKYSEHGGIKMTKNINEAVIYPNKYVAIQDMRRACGKTKNYYVLDNNSNTIIWKWMNDEEKARLVEERAAIKRDPHGKIKRKHYSNDVRKMIYNAADGRCQLCGRPILFSEHTIDHVLPLSMGGLDDVSNLQLCCFPCNQMKNNILPELFLSRISQIFMFQMEKKWKSGLEWNIAKCLLKNLI